MHGVISLPDATSYEEYVYMRVLDFEHLFNSVPITQILQKEECSFYGLQKFFVSRKETR